MKLLEAFNAILLLLLIHRLKAIDDVGYGLLVIIWSILVLIDHVAEKIS